MTPTPALAVRGATVAFGERRVVDGVDLDVAPGAVAVVVGPSGSGKSTLLRAIAGLQPLDAGVVRSGGRDLAGVPAHRRGIGMMFQQPALFPHRDVAANIGFGLERRGADARERGRTVDRMLELVGLSGFGRRSVTELSGGEQQRVALARALAPAPSVLLLDEPMGALDATLRQRLVHDLSLVMAELGVTAVAVTHDRDEAFALADRIVVMDDGRVRRTGTPEELWRDPRDEKVVELLRLGTVVQADRSAGRVRGSWGSTELAGPDGPVTLLLRPEAVVIDPGGDVRAIVATATFRGAVVALELALADGATLRAEVPAAGAPVRGAQVGVRIDPAGVQPVD